MKLAVSVPDVAHRFSELDSSQLFSAVQAPPPPDCYQGRTALNFSDVRFGNLDAPLLFVQPLATKIHLDQLIAVRYQDDFPIYGRLETPAFYTRDMLSPHGGFRDQHWANPVQTIHFTLNGAPLPGHDKDVAILV